jgi:hypothetical protein
MYAGAMGSERSLIFFSPEAVLAVPDRVTDCEGALVIGNQDDEGRPQVLCSFRPGSLVREPLPASVVEVTSVLVLSPADARALARELERAAEEAEEV